MTVVVIGFVFSRMEMSRFEIGLHCSTRFISFLWTKKAVPFWCFLASAVIKSVSHVVIIFLFCCSSGLGRGELIKCRGVRRPSSVVRPSTIHLKPTIIIRRKSTINVHKIGTVYIGTSHVIIIQVLLITYKNTLNCYHLSSAPL